MRPETLDFSARADLTEWMDEPCGRDELKACLRDLAQVNRWLQAYRPVLGWLDSLKLQKMNGTIRIVDVGCGYGDVLRRIERWAALRGIAVELTGIDLNPDAVAIAAEASGPQSAIRWRHGDVFGFAPEEPPHVVVSSLFTHHLAETDIVRFLQWMEGQAEVGWFIHDLSRNRNPYYLFRLLAGVMRLHPFVRHDGPVSIRRSFVPEDWQRMCSAAGLEASDVIIRGYKPGKLCVLRRRTTQR
jgi:2-polyprenyl-3-methyl-5-hydroxy-6-metoxy-1,4-benzoquinol methylase